MDRLSPLAIAVGLVLSLAGCEEGSRSKAPAQVRSRIDVVKATKPTKIEPPHEFCDVYPKTDSAPTFAFPKLDGEAPAAPTTWRWVNLWATWCEPCIEEMPMMLAWKQKLKGEGLPVEQVFLSIDEDREAVARFQKANPTLPPGPQAAEPDTIEEWLKTLGLASGSIPINILVDPKNRIRCVRAGALAEHNYAVVKTILSN